MLGPRPIDEQIHESNPFRQIYTCECGYCHGAHNIGKKCRKCKTICTHPVPATRYYKGYINEPLLRGKRPLNRKEQEFKNNIISSYNLNNTLMNKVRPFDFITERLEDIFDMTITNCKYLDKRILWPDHYEVDMTESDLEIRTTVDHLVSEVFWPVDGEKARDSMYIGDIEEIVEGLSTIVNTNLGAWMMQKRRLG